MWSYLFLPITVIIQRRLTMRRYHRWEMIQHGSFINEVLFTYLLCFWFHLLFVALSFSDSLFLAVVLAGWGWKLLLQGRLLGGEGGQGVQKSSWYLLVSSFYKIKVTWQYKQFRFTYPEVVLNTISTLCFSLGVASSVPTWYGSVWLTSSSRTMSYGEDTNIVL